MIEFQCIYPAYAYEKSAPDSNCAVPRSSAFLGKTVSLNKLKQILEQYLPKDGRRLAEDTLSTNSQEQHAYRRMLELAKKELCELIEQLLQYAKEDLELSLLPEGALSGQEQTLLAKAKEALEEMDYELGSSLF